MAINASAYAHVASAATTAAPTAAEEDAFYSQILRLREAVLAGRHPRFKLAESVIEQLKAALVVPDATAESDGRGTALEKTASALINGSQHSTNQNKHSLLVDEPSHVMPLDSRQSWAVSVKPNQSSSIDPIFLEKSDSLVRAEGQLKRQRIERDLLDQWENRKPSGPVAVRDRDPLIEAPSHIDNDAVLAHAFALVPPISGLKTSAHAGSAASSFDENDYYSSQVQSDWSSNASPIKNSDRAAGAFTADLEQIEGPTDDAPPMTTFTANRVSHPRRVSAAMSADHDLAQFDDLYEPEDDDDDDEYSPPEPVTSGGHHANGMIATSQPFTPEDNESDYEPGEISSAFPTPGFGGQAVGQPSPGVPIIRNHLTHIAAPQPSRVSPLAVQKGVELELVNGRPEIVQKGQPQSARVQSRPSSASPSGNGAMTASRRKNNKKKRKREQDTVGRGKRRKERQGAQSPPSPLDQDPYIKREPISPPPFQNVPEAQSHIARQMPPTEIDLVSPRAPLPQRYGYDPALAHQPVRYEYAQPRSPTTARIGSPASYRPVQRDTQDLRRVATLQHAAYRPASPPQRMYSPVAPYRPASTLYEERPRVSNTYTESTPGVRYHVAQGPAPVRYVPIERSPSPIRLQEYIPQADERGASPAFMPPPAIHHRRIVVDQYGNRFYAAEPAPVTIPSRASVAPIPQRSDYESLYQSGRDAEAGVYSSTPSMQYERAISQMPPPASTVRERYTPGNPVGHADIASRGLREHSQRPTERVRYVEQPTSPVYEEARDYSRMPPPPAPDPPRDARYSQMPPPPLLPSHIAREPTAVPTYSTQRAYSARPEANLSRPIAYTSRQASVAPVQYVQQDAPPPPARAMSGVYGHEPQPFAQDQQTYGYAPQPQVRYVDQYGREVEPQQVRAYRY